MTYHYTNQNLTRDIAWLLIRSDTTEEQLKLTYINPTNNGVEVRAKLSSTLEVEFFLKVTDLNVIQNGVSLDLSHQK